MERKKCIFFIMAAFSVLLLALPIKTWANISEVFGLSPKATGMGNAFTAIADDFSACYYNPAGLAQSDHHQFTVGYTFCQPRFKQYRLSNPNVPKEKEEVNFRSIIFGTLVDLTRIINTRGHNLVLGVAATAGDNFLSGWRFHDWNPEVPRFIRHGDYMNRAHVYSGVGLEVLKGKLYVGAGINFWQNINVPKLTLKTNLLNQEVLEREAIIGADAEISPIFGILIKPFPWLSLGYTYRDEWSLDLPADLTDIIALGPIEIPAEIKILGRDYFLPWNMTVGMAVRPLERLLLSVDVTYYHWSSFDLPMWEGKYPEWDNTVLPRLGVEYRVWEELVLRAGYYYEKSPIPDQSNVPSNHLDFNKHVVSTGLGYSFTKLPFVGELPLSYPISVDTFFQYQIMEDRTQIKSNGQPGWRIEGYQTALGIGISSGF